MQLTFRELETLARSFLSVFLTFFLARVAGDESGFFQSRTQISIKLQQCTRDSVTNCARLTSRAAAVDIYENVEFADCVGQTKRLTNNHAQRFVRKIFVKGATIDFYVAAARTKIHS